MGTFAVDNVTPAAEPLPTQPLGEFYQDALVVGGDPTTPVIEPNGVHPLLHAVARAFADHRPLVLSPDAIWLTVLQGLAQHIRLNAEELRPRLVNHSGRKRLSVTVDGPMPRDRESWHAAVDVFAKLLAAEAHGTDLFECDFSTSTEVERVAGHVVLLDAYSVYFSFWMGCVCGIPTITLTGTVGDWQRIRSRVDEVATFGLQTWCQSLGPILDQFVRASAGDVDTAFWRRIYNPVDAYGGDVVTGWIARFYPYLSNLGASKSPNRLLDLPLDEPRDVTVDGMGFYRGPGIRTDNVPAALSRAIVNVNDQVQEDNRTVALHAGLVGVAQDDNGALRPMAGWHLAPATVEIEDVLDRVAREHTVTSPQPVHEMERYPWFIDLQSAEIVALYQRFGSATLFDGAWRIRSANDQRWIRFGHRQRIVTVIDLADGRSLGVVIETDENDVVTSTHWVVCRFEAEVIDSERTRYHLLDEPSDIPVFGTSLAVLLEAALDSGGDIAHLETGRLAQLVRPGSAPSP